MDCRIRQFFSWALLLGAIALGALLGLGLLNPPGAAAVIRQMEEAPGQVVYQSHQTLQDQHGTSWQAIAFKRLRPTGETSFNLRLVGFPGAVAIDHVQPLMVTTSLGSRLTIADNSSAIFTQTTQPEANVGQYDLQPFLAELHAEIPLQLAVPMLNDDPVRLTVSPALVQEWQTIANQ